MPPRLELDPNNPTSIDASVLSIPVAAQNSLDRKGDRLTIVNPQSQVQQVFVTADLADLLDARGEPTVFRV